MFIVKLIIYLLNPKCSLLLLEIKGDLKKSIFFFLLIFLFDLNKNLVFNKNDKVFISRIKRRLSLFEIKIDICRLIFLKKKINLFKTSINNKVKFFIEIFKIFIFLLFNNNLDA